MSLPISEENVELVSRGLVQMGEALQEAAASAQEAAEAFRRVAAAIQPEVDAASSKPSGLTEEEA